MSKCSDTPTTDARERAREAIVMCALDLGHITDSDDLRHLIDEHFAAILATERARVRAVVEAAPGYQRQGLFVSRADLLARLDAEPTP